MHKSMIILLLNSLVVTSLELHIRKSEGPECDTFDLIKHPTKNETKWKVVYGTMVSNAGGWGPGQGQSSDHELLKTQWSTWLKKACHENRCFATVEDEFSNTSNPNIIRVSNPQPSIPFSETRQPMGFSAHLSYKRPHLFMEAIKRNADWLVLHPTDMFVAAEFLEKLLNKYDPSKTVILAGSFGCGKNLAAIKDVCPENFKEGGLCGGAPYIFSRAALANMLSDGADALVKEYAKYAGYGLPQEMSDGCAFRNHKITTEYLENRNIYETEVSRYFSNAGTEMIYSHGPKTQDSSHLDDMHFKKQCFDEQRARWRKEKLESAKLESTK